MSYQQTQRRGRSHNVGSYRSHSHRSSNHRPVSHINPAKFIHKATAYEAEQYQPTHSFRDFPFSPEIQAAISRKGYVAPSAIQDQAIPYIIEGKDVIGLANTGTGKTAAFLLPIIEHLQGVSLSPSVLIISPTRELAQQTDEEFRAFSRGLGLHSTLVVGGANINQQIRSLKHHPNVIIGTPGRIKDLMQKRFLNLKNIMTLVLDEADRMLDMGFLPDIRQIIGQVPEERQTLFFSATITPDIKALAQDFLKDPVTVAVRTTETSDHVEQDIVTVQDKADRVDKLTELLSQEEFKKVLVFGETKYGVQRLSDYLDNHGIPSTAIHGNKNQSQRQRALKLFKDDRVSVLVATDVAARGLDIPNVTHVINYDQPQTYADYIHRIGRTGRGGASGKALTFVVDHGHGQRR